MSVPLPIASINVVEVPDLTSPDEFPGGRVDPESQHPTNVRQVGRSPVAIAEATKLIGGFLFAAADRAEPRLQALKLAAGTWFEHKHVRQHWRRSFALVLAESITDLVSESRDPRISVVGCRPDAPFTGETPISITVRLLFSYCDSCREFLDLELGFAAGEGSHARVGRVYLAHDILELLLVPSTARPRPGRLYAEVMSTVAHELTHIWQFAHWKEQRPNFSKGGYSDEFSPHSLRPWELYANACMHAAWVVAAAEEHYLYDRALLDRTCNIPNSLWRRYWLEWPSAEYARAHPDAARAARMYQRMFWAVLPCFREVLQTVPPILGT